jgi:hypothetical protein
LLSTNSGAMELLEANPDKINWNYFAFNTNPKAIEMITQLLQSEATYNKINWSNLSHNSEAIDLLKANPDKIDWGWLPCNTNPKVIELMESNIDKLYGTTLSMNPYALHLLAPLDYLTMKETMQPFCKELVEYVLHPVRISRISANFYLELEEYLDLI